MKSSLFDAEGFIGSQYQEVFEPSIRPNVVILGNSRGQHGIDPRQLEDDTHRVYNFAYSGASAEPFYREWYFDWYRSAHKCPDVVIFQVDGISVSEWDKTRIPSFDSRYLPATEFVRMLFNAEVDRSALLYNRYTLIRDRDKLSALWQPEGPPATSPYEYSGVYRGFVPLIGAVPQEQVEQAIKTGARVDHGLKFQAKKAAALHSLIADIQKDGAQVVLVMVPELLTAGESAEARQAIGKLTVELSLPFLNYNAPPRLSELNQKGMYHSDGEHLNSEGAEIFSRQLGKDLASLTAWTKAR